MDKLLKGVSTFGTIFGLGLPLAYSCMYTVDGGERAVLWTIQSGVKDKVYGEGTHFYLPLAQRPYIYDIRTKPKSINTATGTKDLQTVKITLRVLYRPIENKLPELFQTLGLDYDERVLPSIGNEVMKSVVAQYNAEELITRREAVSNEIRGIIKQRAEQFNIEFLDISITDLTFGKEFTQAVENKQVAQQDAEKQKFVVKKSEFERQASIIRAQGESEAARLISDEVAKSGEGLVELRRIEAAREIASKLAKSKNVVYLPKDSNYLFSPKQ